jgi:hypothetical protein
MTEFLEQAQIYMMWHSAPTVGNCKTVNYPKL